jgi:hypothetical protein
MYGVYVCTVCVNRECDCLCVVRACVRCSVCVQCVRAVCVQYCACSVCVECVLCVHGVLVLLRATMCMSVVYGV